MAGRERVSPLAWLLIAPIRFYQRFITPYTPATCRHYPTCSAYAVGCLRRHGAVKGLLLTCWRLLRCNPWSSGGVDKVPERGRWRWREPAADEADGGSPDADGRGERVIDHQTNGDASYVADETVPPAHVGAPEPGRFAA